MIWFKNDCNQNDLEDFDCIHFAEKNIWIKYECNQNELKILIAYSVNDLKMIYNQHANGIF